MSVGSYLSSRSNKLQFDKFERQEYWEIENLHESEVDEIKDIFKAKGFEGKLLEDAVKKTTENKDHWVDIMMKHELQMIKDNRSSLFIGLATFISFIIMGMIPLIIYLIDYFKQLAIDLFFISSCLTAFAFITIGFLKGLITKTNYWARISETVLLGTIAALLAYYVGKFLEQLIV